MHETDNKRDEVIGQAFECRLQLLAYARCLLGDFSVAEDVVQESMLVVVRKADEFLRTHPCWRGVGRLFELRCFERDRSNNVSVR